MAEYEELIKKITDLTNKEINSITLKQTAKGEFYADVKIYFSANDENSGNNAIKQIVGIYDKLSQYGIQPLKK